RPVLAAERLLPSGTPSLTRRMETASSDSSRSSRDLSQGQASHESIFGFCPPPHPRRQAAPSQVRLAHLPPSLGCVTHAQTSTPGGFDDMLGRRLVTA